MNSFFCAEASRQAGEDLIGNGETYQTYVLIECSTPWTANALNSKSIPPNLVALKEELAKTERSVKLLLIYNQQLQQENYLRCIVFRQQDGFSGGYNKQEFQVHESDDLAPALKTYLFAEKPDDRDIVTTTRDILVCTHGSHDKCCAKYGNPFYRQALATVANLNLDYVRIWQCSHFGGHRFAPTAVDFPEGRYYGRLDQASLISILTRTHDIKHLNQVYRGWGILPYSVQALERELMLMHGWDWFNYKVAYRIVGQSKDSSDRIELEFKKPNGDSGCFQAEVIVDANKTIDLIGDCNGVEPDKMPQYTVKNLVRIDKNSD